MLRRCAPASGEAATSARQGRRYKSRWRKRFAWCWPLPRRRSLPPHKRAEPSGFPGGVLNVDKTAGETSFTVVNRLRHLTGAHRVGHAGTLDPLATGVLPILFESATRLAEVAHRLPKTYVADIHLGFSTATGAAEGERQPQGDPSGLTIEDVAEALTHFTGRILQAPPAFSAV